MISAMHCYSSLRLLTPSSSSPFQPGGRECGCCYSHSQGKTTMSSVGVPAASLRCASRAEDDYHSTLKALQSRGRFPRKSLGQNYMLNSAINELMVKEAQLKEGDVVLEIGPGTGALTNALVNAGAHVFAIEKDPHMAMLVSERFNDNGRVKVVQEDFTRYHIEPQIMSFSDSVAPSSNYGQIAKVVSNLPFNIATDVLKLLLPMGDIFSHVVLLLQIQSTDSRLKGLISFPSQICQVDAAVVVFKLKQVVDYPHVASPKGFFSMVNSAFNGKRKMLRKSLQHLCASSDVESALRTLGLPETSRPGELEMDDFVRLYNLLANQ